MYVSMESKCLNETKHVQDDVNLHILRMLEAVHVVIAMNEVSYILN